MWYLFDLISDINAYAKFFIFYTYYYDELINYLILYDLDFRNKSAGYII